MHSSIPDDPTQPGLAGFPPPRLPASHALQTLPVQFNGDARDYFRVWLVNALLTIITFGIWSAWAKVRTQRWFYGHTQIGGHGFEYHATGGQILTGRLLALVVIVISTALSLLSPLVELAMAIAIICAAPWAINAGLRFRAVMTSWRNVRFDFQGSYLRAAYVFLLLPFIATVSFGLLAPVASRLAGRYLANGHHYGGAQFDGKPRLGPLYAAYGHSVLLFVAIMVLSLFIAAGYAALGGIEFSLEALARDWQTVSTHRPDRQPPPDAPTLSLFITMLMLDVYAGLYTAGVYYSACLRQEILGHLTLAGGHRLQSRFSPAVYLWLVISGMLATIFTLTLAYPWARVRRYRYLAQSLTLLAAPGLDELISRQHETPRSFGGEFSQFEGFGNAAPF